MSGKKTVAVDFDGVLNDYTGWKGEDDLGQPTAGTQQFLSLLDADYRVVIYTTRCMSRVRVWLKEHGLSGYVDEVCNEKPMAVAYIDDRAIRFDGDYGSVLVELASFAPHWARR